MDENISASSIPSGKTPAICTVTPQAMLTDRRIYLYMEVKQSASADYYFQGELVFTNGGKPVGSLPMGIGSLTTLTSVNRSLPSMANGGGNTVGDSLILTLANPFVTAPTPIIQAVLQPMRLQAEIDRIQFNLLSRQGANDTGFRVFLGCLSENLF